MRLKVFGLLAVVAGSAIAFSVLDRSAMRPSAAPAAQSQEAQPEVVKLVSVTTTRALSDIPASAVAMSADPYRLQFEPGVARRSTGASRVRDLDAALQDFPMSPLMPAASLTFDGNTAADNTVPFGFTVAPPDTNGDVGPNHYVQTTNLLFRVFNKAGGALTAPLKMSSLYSAGLQCGQSDRGDPIVLYDPLADRWLLAQFAFANIGAPPYHMCIAISTSPNPAGTYFAYDFITPGAEFPDYPHFGVWPNGYFMTVNQFTNGGPFNGTGVYAFQRSQMLIGGGAIGIYFNLNLTSHPEGIGGMLPSDFDGAPASAPATTAPNTFAYFTANEFGDPSDALRLFNFLPNYTTPAASTFTERAESPVLTAAFAPYPGAIQQLGSASGLATLSDRLMHRMQYRKLASGNQCLTTSHTVTGGSGQAAIRWYSLCSNGGAYGFALAPGGQGTFGPDTTHRWMGSAALDKDGNLSVGFSASSSTIFPQLRMAGRLTTDPAGTLGQGEAHLFDGTGSQVNTSNRWGDYSALTVDPSDDCTFWFTSEYYAVTSQFNWKTRIGKFVYPGCGAAGPKPDLTITKVAAPGKSGVGASITVKDTTLNLGPAVAPASTTRIYLSTNTTFDGGDTLLGSRAVPGLASGASSVGGTSVTIPAVAPGVYFILAVADGPGVIAEVSETNNVGSKKITIGPDLVVKTLSAPPSATRGTTFVISDTTKNTGGGGTINASSTRFYLSLNTAVDGGDTILGSRAVPVLGAGGSSGPTNTTTIVVPTSLAPGMYHIIAVADVGGTVAESKETNNKKIISIQIF